MRLCDSCGQPVTDAELDRLKAEFPAEEGPAADIPADLWDLFICHRQLASDNDDIARAAEKTIREIAGRATRLKVNGRVVARRVTREVAGASWRQDSYRQVGK